jgi:heme iron utilization protein
MLPWNLHMTTRTPREQASALLHAQRWACLATLDADGAPLASLVAYAVDRERGALLFHLSRLAAHTRHLIERPQASLAVSAPDDGHGDPQELPRLSLQGKVEAVTAGTPEYTHDQGIYLQRLPTAAPLFELGDFLIFRFQVDKGRFVGGFGRAFSLTAAELFDPAEGGLPHRLSG